MRGRSEAKGKAAAAKEAAKRLKDKQIVGLGSGSTVAQFLKFAAKTIEKRDLDVSLVPSSSQITLEAKKLNLPLRDLRYVNRVDWAVDGADEVDPKLRLVKGGGGALVKERILAHLAGYYLIVVDEGKVSTSIGEKALIPLETTPHACALVGSRLKSKGFDYTLRTNERGYPIITENGNTILDVRMPSDYSPEDFFLEFRIFPGVLDVGIFLDEADEILVGRADGTTEKMLREE
ncbi:MAG: ribose 5-phosphate isomerase A [Candidatus Geothermarchaeales archaeon]